MYRDFQGEGCNFFLKKMSFLAELQPGGYFLTIPDVICTKYLPDLEQLLLGRFYEITDRRYKFSVMLLSYY